MNVTTGTEPATLSATDAIIVAAFDQRTKKLLPVTKGIVFLPSGMVATVDLTLELDEKDPKVATFTIAGNSANSTTTGKLAVVKSPP